MAISLSLCVIPQAFSQTPNNGELRRKDAAGKDWNRIISNQARLKNNEAILSAFTQMEAHGVCPDRYTLPLVFKACSGLNAVDKGRKLHGRIRGSTHLIGDVRVCTAVIDFYCKCGFVEEAFQVFDEMHERDLVSWNAMIAGYVGCGYVGEAIGLFRMMGKDGFRPNSRTLVQLLLACEGDLELKFGKEIHGYSLRNGYFDVDPHMGTALVGFYMNFDVKVSGLVFDSMDVRSSVSWNAMMTGYYAAGYPLLALDVFVQMLELGVKLDSVTILVAVQACSEFGCLKLGMEIHQLATKLGYGKDLFIVNTLINMYSELRSLNSAYKIFDTMRIRDAALWNSMIAAFIEHGYHKEATHLFIRIRTEEVTVDATTFVIMLSSCGEAVHGLESGRMLHAHALKLGIETDVSVGNALLSMYADRNCIEAVKKVFSVIKEADVVSYNTMILAMASSSSKDEAFELFGEMQRSEIVSNAYTMVSLLVSCRDEIDLSLGRSIHGFAVKHGVNSALNTALTAMYITCGDEPTARYLFDACSSRDTISWNAMISSYVKKNQTDEALSLFTRMMSEAEPNPVTVVNVLSICTDLQWGQQLHAYATRRFSCHSIDNALITMYARCGSLKKAQTIFSNLQDLNLISWNAMINAYSTHGSFNEAISTFVQMLDDGLFHPNGVTFLSLLSSCRHSGLLTKGMQIFHSMVHEFNLTPSLSHYGCMVDLLVRSGFLNEAKELVDSMPVEPDASIWRALLNGCRIHSNPEMAALVFQNLVRLEPMNPGNYVLLGNIYAAEGLWSDVRDVRTLLKEKGLKKSPGISWIVVEGEVHCFAAGDTSHPDSVEVYASLESLLDLIRESGYDRFICDDERGLVLKEEIQDLSTQCVKRWHNVMNWLVLKLDELGVEIAQIALPADPIASLVDTAFIGRIGSVELAAVGVSIAIVSVRTSFVAEEDDAAAMADKAVTHEPEEIESIYSKQPMRVN